MNINDRSSVRTATDLERKYNLSKLVRNVEVNDNSIIKVDNELKKFLGASTNSLEDIENEIDGKVTTWYYSGVPSLSNSPANVWTTDTEKTKHVGDLYYDQATGYCYRFSSLYSWVRIKDSEITNAMASASAAQDTADGKRRVFVSQPTTPYDNGDLWVGGSNGDIKVCQISKTYTQSYNANDWIIASKYTDNTVANAIVDELGGTTTTVLNGQVVTISNTFAKYTDLATGGSTTIAGENITTGNIKSSNYVENTSGTNINLTTGEIKTKNVKIDNDGMTLSNGARVLGSDGLKSTLLFQAKNDKTDVIGYGDAYPDTGYKNCNTSINVYIPNGFTITKAIAILVDIPERIGISGTIKWCYPRNVNLYKSNNAYHTYMAGSYPGAEYTATSDDFTIISGALGTNGWTPTLPADSVENANSLTAANVRIESTDIKNSLSEGMNLLEARSPDISNFSFYRQPNDLTTLTDAQLIDMVSRTGRVMMYVIVEGYMTYS